MTAETSVPQAESPTVVRSVRLRLLPESKSIAYQLAGQAGACRFVWNHFLARNPQDYAESKDGKQDKAPDLSF